MYRVQIAVCKMEVTLIDDTLHYIALFAEQLTRTFEVLVNATLQGETGLKDQLLHLTYTCVSNGSLSFYYLNLIEA